MGQTATPSYVLAAGPSADEGQLDWFRRVVIADALARFMRARGEQVLFPPPFEGERPEPWHQLSTRLDLSVDWSAGFSSSEPTFQTWSQRLFVRLLDHDLLYATGSAGDDEASRSKPAQWMLRLEDFVDESEDALTGLSDWGEAAMDNQRSALGRQDGFEVDAAIVGGGTLAAFIADPERVSDAAFVAISPNLPNLATLLPELDLPAALAALADEGPSGELPRRERFAPAGGHVVVPGAPGLLPIIISPLVDLRVGKAAVFGIPSLDPVDAGIAARLSSSDLLPIATAKGTATVRPASKHRLVDVPVSRLGGEGPAVPVSHCESCGAVPVQPESLQPSAPACPRCGGAAKPDLGVFGPTLPSLAAWLLRCVPKAERASLTLELGEHARWLPLRQLVVSEGAGQDVLRWRLLARALQEVAVLPPLPDGEPVGAALVTPAIRADSMSKSTADLDSLLAEVGADVLRLTVLQAAAPRNGFEWSPFSTRYAERFLEGLSRYVEPRLRVTNAAASPTDIDRSSRPRRRLAAWCQVASEKITENFERAETHRAAANAALFLRRIRDFESGREEDGDLDANDREGVAIALARLLLLFAPCAPEVTGELWARAGMSDDLGAEWPV